MATFALVVSCLSLALTILTLRFAYATAKRWRTYTRIDPKPVCGCNHHASFHDDEGCHCINTDSMGRVTTECGCKKYMGPEPLPEMYLP